MEIKKNELLKNHTSFKIGGPADEFASVSNEQEIIELIGYARKKGIPYTIMGNGSNLLVSDKGIRGLVIKLSKENLFKELKLNQIVLILNQK